METQAGGGRLTPGPVVVPAQRTPHAVLQPAMILGRRRPHWITARLLHAQRPQPPSQWIVHLPRRLAPPHTSSCYAGRRPSTRRSASAAAAEGTGGARMRRAQAALHSCDVGWPHAVKKGTLLRMHGAVPILRQCTVLAQLAMACKPRHPRRRPTSSMSILSTHSGSVGRTRNRLMCVTPMARLQRAQMMRRLAAPSPPPPLLAHTCPKCATGAASAAAGQRRARRTASGRPTPAPHPGTPHRPARAQPTSRSHTVRLVVTVMVMLAPSTDRPPIKNVGCQ